MELAGDTGAWGCGVRPHKEPVLRLPWVATEAEHFKPHPPPPKTARLPK